MEVFFRPSVQKEKMTGVKFFILLFVLSCLQTMTSEGRSFQDRGNGYTEGPYGEFGPIEASAGDASFRMTWTSAVCVYGTVALVLLFKGWWHCGDHVNIVSWTEIKMIWLCVIFRFFAFGITWLKLIQTKLNVFKGHGHDFCKFNIIYIYRLQCFIITFFSLEPLEMAQVILSTGWVNIEE